MVAIYQLLGPRTGAVRYVGATPNPIARLRAHRTAVATNDQLLAWLQELKQLGLLPVLQMIELVGEINAHRRERFWIRTMQAAGAPHLPNRQAHASKRVGALKLFAACDTRSDKVYGQG
ncbi:MAG: GIY-YIG nuclease family protein [Candidatus Entotheonellia bacterium]